MPIIKSEVPIKVEVKEEVKEELGVEVQTEAKVEAKVATRVEARVEMKNDYASPFSKIKVEREMFVKAKGGPEVKVKMENAQE